jgi:hypothetical protein
MGDSPTERRYHDDVGETQWNLSLRSIPELKRVAARAELVSVSLLDGLDLDHRPSFAIDVSSDVPQDGQLDPVYSNPALTTVPRLVALIEGRGSLCSLTGDALALHAAFKNWIWGIADLGDRSRRGKAYVYGDHLWWATATERYKVVSGTPMTMLWPESARSKPYTDIDISEHRAPQNMPQFVPEHPPSTLQETLIDLKKTREESSTPERHGPFDCTLENPPEVMSDHVRNFRSIDWAATSLGPMKSWSLQLRCIVNMMMNDHNPAVLFWGDEVIMIYNEAYIQLISLLHPCMGQSARVAASTYWPLFQPIVDHIYATGETVSNRDMPLFLDRHGFLEETFFSFQFIPVLDSDGHVSGFYQPLVETTK